MGNVGRIQIMTDDTTDRETPRCEICRYRRKSGLCTLDSVKTEAEALCDWFDRKRGVTEPVWWGKE